MLDCKKDVYYDFVNNPRYDWVKLLTRLAASFIKKLNLQSSARSCFIVDDTVLPGLRAKKVELGARVFDHVIGKTVKGFTQLLLSWTDGESTIPVDFSVLSSADAKNRLTEADSRVDMRTCGGKRRKEAVMHKPDMVIELLKRAMAAGIHADYILPDTWFTNDPMLLRLKETGIHAVGMVKNLKQRYCTASGNTHTLTGLRNLVNRGRAQREDKAQRYRRLNMRQDQGRNRCEDCLHRQPRQQHPINAHPVYGLELKR